MKCSCNIAQGFGGPKSYLYKYLSYLEFHPMVTPFLGYSSAGNKNTRTGFSRLSTPTQTTKSIFFSLPVLLKLQYPFCSPATGFPRLFFLKFKWADFTSTSFPFQSRSARSVLLFLPLKTKCLAFKSFATYFSHLKPIPVWVKKKESGFLKYVVLWRLQYQSLLRQTFEQYILSFLPDKDIAVLQKRQLLIINT